MVSESAGGINLKDLRFENEEIEYKTSWKDEYLKTLCAFANTKGGQLIIGIKDNHEVVGVQNFQKLLEYIPNKVKNSLGIIPSLEIKVVDGKNILVISVQQYDTPVYYDEKIYVRSGSNTVELTGQELTRFIFKKFGKSWEKSPTSVTIDQLDLSTVELFKKLAKERLSAISEDDSIEKVLYNLELMSEDGYLNNAGVLLFGKDPSRQIDAPWVRIGRFGKSNSILDTVDAVGNLFRQLEIVYEAIKKNINVRFSFENTTERKEIWDYPLIAIREAIINALVHRDYAVQQDTQIKIFDNAIWFWNPGTLPEGIRVEDLKNSVHISKPRNRIIARVFYYARMIEQWGTGTSRIIDSCLNQGLPEPEFKEENGGFSVYLYKDMYTEDKLRKMGLNERQIMAVIYVQRTGKITNKEYQELTGVKERMAGYELNELVKLNILERIGKTGKGTFYTIKGAKGAVKTQ